MSDRETSMAAWNNQVSTNVTDADWPGAIVSLRPSPPVSLSLSLAEASPLEISAGAPSSASPIVPKSGNSENFRLFAAVSVKTIFPTPMFPQGPFWSSTIAMTACFPANSRISKLSSSILF